MDVEDKETFMKRIGWVESAQGDHSQPPQKQQKQGIRIERKKGNDNANKGGRAKPYKAYDYNSINSSSVSSSFGKNIQYFLYFYIFIYLFIYF